MLSDEQNRQLQTLTSVDSLDVIKERYLHGKYGQADLAKVMEDEQALALAFCKQDGEQQQRLRRLEDALCGAICVIRNEAGLATLRGSPQYGETLRRWASEYESESGIDFTSVLGRVNNPHSVTHHQ